MRRRIEFSIIIPIPLISPTFVNETLQSLSSQTFKSFETIVLADACTDACLKIHNKFSWLTIVHLDKSVGPAQKRNKGAGLSRGAILAFLDADAFAPNYWLQRAKDAFKKRQSAAVCGPGILPKHAGFGEQLFNEASRSFLGSGSLRYRFTKQKTRFVDDYPTMNFFIKKEVFEAIGGFKTRYWPGEDSKLCNDIVYKQKEKILYSPSITIYHHRRNTLKDFIVQHMNYGFHRGLFFAQGDRNSRKFFYLIPSVFMMYFVVLLYAPFVRWRISYLPLTVYLLGMMLLSLLALKNTRNLVISFSSPVVLLMTHVAYGASFMYGLSVFYAHKTIRLLM